MALSLNSVPQFGGLNAYWGQHGGYRLRDICDSGVQFATVSFVNNSPENANGYPGTNFGANCGGPVYVNPSNGKDTQLLIGCTQIQEDIPYCKAKGVKVLLGLGGEWSQYSRYDVSTNAKGVEFAEFLYNAYGPYKSSWTGPRPFDLGNGAHTSVDGFDFDTEQKGANNGPYIAMIEWFRQKDSNMLITAAPQCVITKPGGNTNDNDDLIKNAQFDALFVQFYNNAVCDAIPNNTPGDQFSYDAWVNTLKASKKSKNAKLFIGLPASLPAVNNNLDGGYITPKAMKDLICQYKSHANFGGVSLWDGTFALQNQIKLDPTSKTDVAKSYIQHALDALQYGCGTVPPPTTSSAKPTSTTTTSSTSKATSSTSKATSSTSKATSSTSKATSTTSKATSTTTTSSSKVTSSTSTSVKVTSTTTSSVKATSSTTSKQQETTTSKQPQITTTSEQHETTTSKQPQITTTSEQHETTTSEQPQITTTSAQEQTTSTSVAITSSQWSNSTTSSVEMTTKTVYTTSVHTISKCPPAVTDCPYKTGHVVTETIPLYTTVCPVTETAHPHKPTTTKAPPALTTSTVYTTKTHTITSCPPQVTNCPVGHVTTEVVPLYTTVCPVEETQTAPATTVTVVPVVTMETSTRAAGQTTKVCVGPGCPGASSAPGAVCPGGPNCPPASSAPGAVCPGPNCPGATTAPGSGCTGPECPGVAIPTNSWTKTVSPVNPTAPVTAGASTLALGLTGLIAMVAAQVLAL